jgi:hypothetical protein
LTGPEAGPSFKQSFASRELPTFVTLIPVPVLYRIQEDVQRGVRGWLGLSKRRYRRESEAAEA